MADPAAGAKVVRCRTCGHPGGPGNRLMLFGLVLHRKAAGSYRLCERCWWEANPAQPVDPLQVA